MSKEKNKTVGEILQEKADAAKDQRIRDAILSTDISGLDKSEAKQKLRNAMDDAEKSDKL